MIIYLSGPDSFRREQTLSQMKDKFLRERDPQGMNLNVITAGEIEDSALLEQLYAAPFLAEKRMVVLKHIIEKGTKELHALLLERMNDGAFPEDIIIVATDGTVKPRAKASKELLALLESQSYSKKFDLATGSTLGRWIQHEVTQRGGSIAREAMQAITNRTWEDTQVLSGVIDQLVAYAGAEEISKEAVLEFLPQEADDNIFLLVDTAVAGNKQKVFSLIRQQYAAGKDPHYIFSMLLRQYRIMLDIADALDRGARPDAKTMGLHPFVLKKTTPLVQRISLPIIKEKYLELLKIDKEMKTGGDAEVLIDVFVGSL